MAPGWDPSPGRWPRSPALAVPTPHSSLELSAPRRSPGRWSRALHQKTRAVCPEWAGPGSQARGPTIPHSQATDRVRLGGNKGSVGGKPQYWALMGRGRSPGLSPHPPRTQAPSPRDSGPIPPSPQDSAQQAQPQEGVDRVADRKVVDGEQD